MRQPDIARRLEPDLHPLADLHCFGLLGDDRRGDPHAGRAVDMARAVLATLDSALDGCVAGRFGAMVTAPVHKGVINEAGVQFTGHTEYLAEKTGTPLVVMMLAVAVYTFLRKNLGQEETHEPRPGDLWRGALFGLVMGTMLLPSFMNMIPTFMIMDTLGWIDQPRALYLPAAAPARLAPLPDRLADHRLGGAGRVQADHPP